MGGLFGVRSADCHAPSKTLDGDNTQIMVQGLQESKAEIRHLTRDPVTESTLCHGQFGRRRRAGEQ